MHDDLYSIPLERHVLATLYKHPDTFTQIEAFLSENDFSIPFHGTCFCVLKDSFFKKEKVDKVVWAQKLKNLGVVKYEDVDVFSYIENITYTQINQDAGLEACKELVKLRVLRELVAQNDRAKDYIVNHRSKSLDEIIVGVDRINNEIVKSYEFQSKPINIFDGIKEYVEGVADNPPKDFLLGPFDTVNKIYGTLLPPAGINLVGARTGSCKSALSMYYMLWVAEKYNLPLLNLDVSEMLDSQLKMRAVTMFTNGVVPYNALVRGTWRGNPEWERLVKEVWPRVKKLKMFYCDIGGMQSKEILSLVRRIYYGQVGRGNVMLLNYDYIKSFGMVNTHVPEYQQLGHFIQDYKSLVNNEIPQIRSWFSLQTNRSGITNNKKADQIEDNEGSFSISDRLIQIATSAWLLRSKTNDEISAESNRYGNYKFIPLKFRELLGDHYKSHFEPVIFPDGSVKRNYINLDVRSFFFREIGDTNSMVRQMREHYNLSNHVDGDNATL